MTNVYFLENTGQASVDYDDANIIHTAQDGVLVECSFDTAAALATEWNTASPKLAADGLWVSESGDETLIAGGEIVNDIAVLADVLGYNDKEDGASPADYGIDYEDFLRLKNRVF